jgi:hypothetical protein
MRFTEENQPKQRPRRSRLRRSLLISAGCLALAVYSGLVFVGGVAYLDFIRPSLLNLTGTTGGSHAVRALVAGPGNYVGSVLAAEPVETLHVDIRFERLMKIREKRDEALRLGVLMSSDADFVPAEIRHRDRTVRVKLRLKGDYTDHFEGDKWSFRVETRGDDSLFGMRRFSLQAPRTRGYQAEPVVFAHLRREGILTPRYFFVDVVVNGRDIGLMAVEEHFSKELLESQDRREGVIIRFDEDPFFQHRLENGNHGPYDNLLTATIRPFRASKIHDSPVLTAQLHAATGLLRAFLAGELPAAEVFDLDLFGRFLAVAEVWRSLHVVRWHNLRFYMNPITQRLEPIAFDVNMQSSHVGPGLVVALEQFPRLLLEDLEMRSHFVRHLRRVAGEFVDGRTSAWLEEEEQPLLDVLHREFPFRAGIDLEPLVARAHELRAIDLENFAHYAPWGSGPATNYASPVMAYLHTQGERPELELVNTLPVPVEVSQIRLAGFEEGSASSLLDGGEPLRLSPTPLGEAPSSVRIPMPPRAEPFRVEARVRVEGQQRRYTAEALPYSPLMLESPIPSSTSGETSARHAFLSWDEANGLYRAEPGVHTVKGSLVLPLGAGLRLESGTVLRFAQGEALIASGPLDFAGTGDAPVVLEPVPGAESWAGIVVLRSDRPFAWRHTLVRHTAGIARGSWVLTGGVTLRASRVSLASVTFEGNRAEDALNLVRARFEMTDVHIRDAASDALDSDFSNGAIRGGLIERVGGDGVDVSGTVIEVDGLRLDEIHDKAISVGEASRLVARNVHIARVGTAIAGKDGSRTLVEDSHVDGVAHVALMAYQKKPEFGPAEVVATRVSLRNVGREAVAQLGSRIELDGRVVVPEDVDVEALYERGPMRK